MLTADRILYVVSFSSLIQNMQVQYLQVLLLTYILHLCRLIFLRGRTEETYQHHPDKLFRYCAQKKYSSKYFL